MRCISWLPSQLLFLNNEMNRAILRQSKFVPQLVRFFSNGQSKSISSNANTKVKAAESCSTPTGATDDDDEDEMEDMFVQGPAGMEWGGPTRGGRRPEPTRFGDWERKGRASDF